MEKLVATIATGGRPGKKFGTGKTKMSLYNLDSIFQPASVAVVGASEKEGSIGQAVINNLIQGGFQGEIYPVNPRHKEIAGLACYKNLSQTPAAPDMAVLAIPIDKIPKVMDECAENGVKGTVILSAGGRETGQEGRKRERRIKEKADKGGIRIIGPNCLGVVSTQKRLNASFAAHMPPDGPMAFISQSGAICSAMLDLSLKENMGYKYFISIGSMLDADFGDLVDYVGSDPEVNSVLLYLESLRNFRKFMSATRAVSRLKPVVILKAGKSRAGARAASSHTGALAGNDAVYEAAFSRAGAVRVRNLRDFFDCAELLAKQKRPRGRRLTIITNSGGPGVMTADAVSEYGLSLADLGQETIQKLDQVLPPYWSRGNPLDIIGDADSERYINTLQTLDPQESDGTLVILNPQAMMDPTQVAEDLCRPLQQQAGPVITSWMGGREVEKGTQLLNQAGIPTYPTPEQAVKAFRYLYAYGRNLELLQEIPPRIEQPRSFDRETVGKMLTKGLERENGLLTEYESKKVLGAYAIPVNPTRQVESKQAARQTAHELGYPLAMKISSPDIVHKTRFGGVRLNLDTEKDLTAAYEELLAETRENHPEAAIKGVTLQPMQSIDLELLLGAQKDPDFGPVLLFGWGGIHTEALADRSISLAPINRLLARRMMEDTRIYAVLTGEKGPGKDALEDLEKILTALSHLVVDFPQIRELDINPAALVGNKPVAVDARLVVEKTGLKSPAHLSISPYPEKYEEKKVAAEGVNLFIRPIKPEDAPLLQDLFAHLSQTTIYQRFFSALKCLPHDMLVRFTQIDYDREIALVALKNDGDKEGMLGVARVMGMPGGMEGEFAVLVADRWQGRGIGAALLKRSLKIVQERGMKKVGGLALAKNSHMANLAAKLGFDVRQKINGEYEMTIDLEKADLQ